MFVVTERRTSNDERRTLTTAEVCPNSQSVTFLPCPSISSTGDPMRHLLALAAALPIAAFAQSDFNWSGALSPGQTLEIKNINGDIRAELASGNMVEVTAHKSANRSDVATVRIEV